MTNSTEAQLAKRITERNGVLVFLHLGKTGGTTFKRDVLQEVYKDRIISGHWKQVPLWSKEDRFAVDLITAHIWYGYHKCLREPYLYITIFRHPIDCAVSRYYYLRERGKKGAAKLQDYLRYSLEELILRSEPESYFRNSSTRILSGAFSARARKGIRPIDESQIPKDDELLRLAEANLRKDFIFGFQEELDETISHFCALFGWGKFVLQQHRKNPHRPRLKEVPKSTKRIIADVNRLDLELYDYARSLLRDRMAKD